jgi:hypothetical protein
MTLVEILTPVIGTITIIAVCVMIGALIHLFLEKTEMGARIKDATPWMGWYQDVDENYTNFVIHPDNYRQVPTR